MQRQGACRPSYAQAGRPSSLASLDGILRCVQQEGMVSSMPEYLRNGRSVA